MTGTRGFTLIELLVVISIISLLSAVMLTSFETGRLRAQDAAIKKQVTEMRTLMYREFSDTGTYTNLKASNTTGEVSVAESCPTVGTGGSNLRGTYALNFRNACEAIRSTLRNNCGSSDICLKFDRPSTGLNFDRKFSIAVYLPYASRAAGGDRFWCMGSNGRTSVDDSVLDGSGCPNDSEL